MNVAGPSVPPPTKASYEVSELEPLLPLTQPPPKEDADPPLSLVEGPQAPEE